MIAAELFVKCLEQEAAPFVLDVPVDDSENARLTERLGKLVCPI